MTMEAEIGVMHLQVKECQGLLATPVTKRKVWNRFSPGASRENVALLITLIASRTVRE